MAQYPTVYNQNTGDDEKDGSSLGLDLGIDNDDDAHSKYADGDEESKSQQNLEVDRK